MEPVKSPLPELPKGVPVSKLIPSLSSLVCFTSQHFLFINQNVIFIYRFQSDRSIAASLFKYTEQDQGQLHDLPIYDFIRVHRVILFPTSSLTSPN